MDYAVEMRSITKRFGEKAANDKVDLKIRPGSIHALLGENGAGKSTLMNMLYGHYRPDSGEIYIRGQKQDISSPLIARELGIGMVHQHFMLVKPLTVTENIMLKTPSQRGALLKPKLIAQEIRRVSDMYGLNVNPDAKIRDLAVGEQQRVEILSAVYQGADILILDEPTAVLTPQETEALFDILRQMRESGKSVILITHKLDEIVEIADEVSVLRDGVMIGSRVMTPEVTKNELTHMMIGRDAITDFSVFSDPHEAGRVVIDIKNVHAKNNRGVEALKGIDLTIHEGEILGLAGVDGNGQKELAQVLTGLMRITKGEIIYDGKRVENKKPIDYIDMGIGHVPEDRQTTGAAMSFSIKNNMIIKNYADKRFRSKLPFLIDYDKVNTHAEDLMDQFDIRAKGRNQLVGQLSGGNQQKVILAREIDAEPRFLIASQPTRGLDIGAAESVQTELIKQRNKGAAILLISANLDEIMQLSDRIAVIFDGRITGVLPRGTKAQEIGLLMLNQKEEENHA